MSNINVMMKRLGPVTAYKYAVQQGYTGTEQEFAALMASYATVAETATQAAEDAEDAADRAEAAAEALEIDDTLTLSGRSADAKKTGDEIADLKADLGDMGIRSDTLEDYVISVDSGISMGEWSAGAYFSPSTGANGSLAYGCRSGYIDIFVGVPGIPVPLMLVANFDLTVYKYAVYAYGTHSASSATESLTKSTWTTKKRTLLTPASGSLCIRICVIRQDAQGSITSEQAADIASKIKLMRVTDQTLLKPGIAADARATGRAIEALKNRIYPNTKKIAFFGDSFTWGRDGSVTAIQQVSKPIPEVVSEKLGVVTTNYGVGGMGWLRVADHPGLPETNAYGMISNTDLSDYDYVVLDFGVNDGYKPIGEWDSSDETTLAGQINKCLNYIKTTYPEIVIIMVAPWNGCNVGSYPDYWYGDVTGMTINNTMRYSRQELRNVEARICQNLFYAFIDIYDAPINSSNIVDALPDGVHATAEYYVKVGEWLAAKIGRMVK